MKATISRVICIVCLLIFITSIIIYAVTDIINAYAFMILTLGSILVFIYFFTDILFCDSEDDEKKR